MQIHELNNFAGTLGSGAYLPIDDGTDTGKISSQGLLAATEARIDNIIAGPAPSAEEIVDARLGADGVNYPTLGGAIRTQVTDLKSELTDETNARILLAGRMTTAEGDIDTLETHKVAQPLDEDNQPTDGTEGQSLRTKGDGTTEWADVGLPTDEQTAQAVSDWLDEHPEATTTVEDGAITEPKLGDTLKSKVNNEYVSANIEFLYHLASDTPNGWGYGMCCVMWNSEHCIVSDFGADSDGSTLVNFLIAKGIHKVDAVIISHYHGDHARETSVKALLDSVIDTTNCVFYLPHKDIEWASFIGTSATDPMANESAVKALLSSYGIESVEPTSEGYSVDVGEFNLKFYNVSSAYYSDYYSWTYLPRSGTISSSTRYNNFSMCTMVNVGCASFFLSGDIEKPAQENMSDAVKSADGILIPHHGIDLVESEAFVDSISAKVGVIAQYSYPNNENLDGELSPTAQKCKSIGTLLTTKTKNVALSVKGGALKALTGTTAKGLSLGDAVIEGGDLNDLDYGFAIISDGDLAETIANVPENFNRTSYYFTFPLNKNTTEYNRICQIGFCVENGTSPALAYRRKYGGEWNDWTYFSIPYNAQDTFAIGTTAYTIVRLLHQFVLNPRDVRGHIPLGEITNLNSCTTSGIYMCTNTATGIPSNINSASYVMVMSFKNSSGLVRCIQFLVPYDSASVAPWQVIMMRRYTEGASTPWTTWYRSAAFEALS